VIKAESGNKEKSRARVSLLKRIRAKGKGIKWEPVVRDPLHPASGNCHLYKIAAF
jgi:hypothetical protein